jgi:hypothetical protein
MDKPTISQSKAEEVRLRETKAFIALGDYFFIAKGRKRNRRGYVDIHVKPEKLEKLFESWLSARLNRHDYLLQDAKDVLKMMQNEKCAQAINHQIKPAELFQSDMRQCIEMYENQMRDDMMMGVVASVLFTLFGESTKLTDLRNQMKTFTPLMRKLQKRALERSKQKTNQNGLSSNPFFQNIWARQKDRGVII